MMLMLKSLRRFVLVLLLIVSGCATVPKHVAQTMSKAEQGDAQSQYQLGLNYTNGIGVTQDYTKGAQWFLKSAQQGKSEAQFMMGAAYASGRGVVRDETQAYQWFDKAANQGNSAALYQKADALANGRGTTKDIAASRKFYEKAARLGHVESQYSLGVLLMTGRGGKIDKIMGNAWVLAAADHGNKDAKALFDTTSKKLTKKQLKKVKALAKKL
nr:tetratricopeptide repeat protein [uncultured Tolumonas sp.]